MNQTTHSSQTSLALALSLHQGGQLAEAEAAYQRILSREPGNAEVLHLLGALCLQTYRLDSAVALLRRAVALRPRFPDALNNLGVALEAKGEFAEAEAAYARAVGLRPDYVDALNNLGNVLRRLGRVEEAERAHRRALQRRPSHNITHTCLGATALEKGDLDDALKHYWRAASLQPDSPAAHSELLFWLLHHPRYTDQQIFEAHLKWASWWCGLPACSSDLWCGLPACSSEAKEKEQDAGWKPAPQRTQTLRVGYISPDFREHTVSRFFEPVLANHDPAAVTSVCYSDVARPDAVTKRLRAVAGEWHETAGLSVERLAAKIRGDRIDVLVDLTGHMGGGRLTVFARRPAPVQATYLGYPHTTGVAAIAYRITDAVSDPVGMTERFHVEKLVRLEGCVWCYRPDDCGAGFQPALPKQRRKNKTQAGSLHHKCTTCDLLWLGVPTVTLAVTSHRARVGASLMGAVGLGDLVAADEEGYVRAAAGLAADGGRLRGIRGDAAGTDGGVGAV